MSDDHGLQIHAMPVGRNGTVTLTAYLGREPVAVEKLEIAKSEKRDAFASSLVEKMPGIDRATIDRELLKAAAEHANRVKPDAKPTSGKSAEDLLAETPDDVKQSARRLSESPDLMKRIIDDVAALGVAGERELIATTYLVGTSRLLARPLSMIAQGPSSSGKSYCVSKAASLFPPEAVVVATQLTPQALFYMEPGSLEHRFVVVGERSRVENDDTAEATRALREMQSAGRLSKLVTMKVDGKMRSCLVEQEGPIAYVESTTLTKLFNEDANRCIILGTDERPEQTRRIIANVAAGYSGATRHADAERIVAQHHALQRMLAAHEVVIPFAERLGERFNTARVEARRAFPHLLNMVATSALLHQRQRRIDADGRILATIDDYQIARHLLAKPFGRQLGGGVSDGAVRFYERLKSWTTGPFTTTDAAKKEKGENSDRAVRGWISELHEAAALELVEPPHGPKPAVWKRLDAEVGGDGGSILPKPEAVSDA